MSESERFELASSFPLAVAGGIAGMLTSFSDWRYWFLALSVVFYGFLKRKAGEVSR